MKYIPLALLILLLYLVSTELGQPNYDAIELVPNTNPSICICFEYTDAASGGANETVYQSCDVAVLDQVGLPDTEITILELPCDRVFKGVKIIENKALVRHILDTIIH